MKFVFVETPSPWVVRQNAQVALGPLYLATILKMAGHEVRVARPKNKEEFIDFQDADVISMSGTTLEYPMNEECARWIRQHLPEMRIFIGGTHATAMFEEITESLLFDSICVGEGEMIIFDMIRDLKDGKLKKVYLSGGFIEDLDSIPFPDRSLIEGSHGGDIFAFGKSYIGQGNENIITSRGCPFRCAFCSGNLMWKKKLRYRSIKNVIEEVEQIIATSEIKQLRVSDDALVVNKKRFNRFCEAIADFNLAWRLSVRADNLTPEICEKLAVAGCKEISPGIESGDQRVLDFLNKRTTTEKMRIGCRNAKEAGIKVRGLFLIGTPGEMLDTPEINRDYIEELAFDIITLSTFIPLPGSPIWSNPEAYNCSILSTDFRKYNNDYWIMKNGQKVEREYEPLIHNKLLTMNQMRDNVERMERYVKETGKQNTG